MGRKKKEITPDQMRKIASYALDGCQNGTIEMLMGWHEGFIHERRDIRRFLLEKRAERKRRLYHAQTNKAIKSNDTVMQIWLGKNELDQKDKRELTGADGGPIVVIKETLTSV